MNVNLDMVSRNDRNEIFAAGTYHYPQFTPMLEDVRSRARVQVLFGHDRPLYRGGGVDDWTRLSDHYVFHSAGVPFVYFGVEDHADYHTPTDTADKIDRRFFGDVGGHDHRRHPHVRRASSLMSVCRYASARSSGTTPVACANCQVSVYCWNRTAFPSRRSQTCATCASIVLPVAFAVPL